MPLRRHARRLFHGNVEPSLPGAMAWVEPRLASDDYPELAEILVERPPLEGVSKVASWRDQQVEVRGEAKPLNRIVGGKWYHGTGATLRAGDRLSPGRGANFSESPLDVVSITSEYSTALYWAKQVAPNDPKVYEVEPVGDVDVWRVTLGDYGKGIVVLEGRVSSAVVLGLAAQGSKVGALDDTVVLWRGVSDYGGNAGIWEGGAHVGHRDFETAEELLAYMREDRENYGRWWGSESDAKFYAGGYTGANGDHSGVVIAARFPAGLPADGDYTGAVIPSGTVAQVERVEVWSEDGWRVLPHRSGLTITAASDAGRVWRGIAIRGLGDEYLAAQRSGDWKKFAKRAISAIADREGSEWQMTRTQGGIGNSWTFHVDTAKKFAGGNGLYVRDFDALIPIVIEADYESQGVVRDPERDGHAFGYDGREEYEVVMTDGAPLVLAKMLIAVSPNKVRRNASTVYPIADWVEVDLGQIVSTAGIRDWLLNKGKEWADSSGTPADRAWTYDWCRFRRNSHCYYPKHLNKKASKEAGYAVWIPVDRGVCPRDRWEDQKACPAPSEPGPKSGEREYGPDATVAWEDGGQRRASATPLTIRSEGMPVPDFKGSDRNMSKSQVLAACKRIIKDVAQEFGYTGGLPAVEISEYMPTDAIAQAHDPTREFPDGLILLADHWLRRAQDRELGYHEFRIVAHEAVHALVQRDQKSYPGFSQMITEGGAEVLSAWYWAKNAPSYDRRDSVWRQGEGWTQEGQASLIASMVYGDWVEEVLRRAADIVGWNPEAMIAEIKKAVAGDHNTKLEFRNASSRWDEHPLPPGVRSGHEGLMTWLLSGVKHHSASAGGDGDWGFHVQATWRDVQAKAKTIRENNHVRILAVTGTYITGEVKGDSGVYRCTIMRTPGSKSTAMWECGCSWSNYAWGRSGRWKRYEGRMCSHALALTWEAQSREMFGKTLSEDREAPEWSRGVNVAVPGQWGGKAFASRAESITELRHSAQWNEQWEIAPAMMGVEP